MAELAFKVDPETQRRLGPEVLAGLRANLWRVDCQTCGRPFGRWGRPALEVRAQDGYATASLHHPKCRPPGWVDGTIDTGGGRHLTWQAGVLLLEPADIPVFLVNPSYEYAFLRDDDGGGTWRMANLDLFTGLGFQLKFPSKTPPPLPALSASIDEGRISVDVRNEGSVLHAWHDVPLTTGVARVVHDWGGILVAVTTLVDVRKPFRVEALLALIGSGRVALGQARLASVAYSPPAQKVIWGGGSEARAESFALTAVSMKRALELEVDDGIVAAAFALSEGETLPARRLAGRERSAVLLMVSAYYALDSRDEAGEPVRARGVHLILPDAASADELAGMFAAIGDRGAIGSVGRVGAPPLSTEGAAAYLSDIAIGTAEEFAAALDAYGGAGPDWDLHASRGHLAIAVDAQVESGVLGHYPKVLAL